MGPSLNPLTPLKSWRRDGTSAAKLYGAIVAQARLPAFYQGFGVPDTLQGRFLVLSLHLFAVLYRLKAEGPPARNLAQDLTDRFSADMETVLREIGVGDLSIPKKVRGLWASSAGLLQAPRTSRDQLFGHTISVRYDRQQLASVRHRSHEMHHRLNGRLYRRLHTR